VTTVGRQGQTRTPALGLCVGRNTASNAPITNTQQHPTRVLPMRQRHSRGHGCWGARASSLLTPASRRGRQGSLAVIFLSPMGSAVTPCEDGPDSTTVPWAVRVAGVTPAPTCATQALPQSSQGVPHRVGGRWISSAARSDERSMASATRSGAGPHPAWAPGIVARPSLDPRLISVMPLASHCGVWVETGRS
jgi:hypothetical protein